MLTQELGPLCTRQNDQHDHHRPNTGYRYITLKKRPVQLIFKRGVAAAARFRSKSLEYGKGGGQLG